MGTLTSGRFLIDTHVLLWMLTEPERLSVEAASLLGRRDIEVLVSAASAWEISTKQRLGKLPKADVLVRAYDQHLRRLGARTQPISAADSLLAGSLDWHHRDPFDRMIAAQCMIESVPLVTRDAVFDELSGLRILW